MNYHSPEGLISTNYIPIKMALKRQLPERYAAWINEKKETRS